ncbi:MAG: hypothetical protein AAAFM81_07415, partial [Pseudomonadota bacterium]
NVLVLYLTTTLAQHIGNLMPANQRNQGKIVVVSTSAYRIERGLLLAMTCALPLSFWANDTSHVTGADVAALASDSTTAPATELSERSKIAKTNHGPAVKYGWLRFIDFK